MSGFEAQKRLLFARPIHYILRGFCCQPSAFDRVKFCVYVFVQPLFVPEDAFVFDLGQRLGAIAQMNEKWWSYSKCSERATMDDVHTHMVMEGAQIFDKFTTLRDIADHAVAEDVNPYNLYSPEMAAYAAILLDDRKTADKMFDAAEARFAKSTDRRDWVVSLMGRIRSMRDMFHEDSAEAKAVLQTWRKETAANLKLTEFLAPVE